nr:MAG TPA: hypothetical protein [Caudoviricetes sp.]
MAQEIKHALREGDILASSWGWEQTNVSFYKVVKATPTGVRVRPMRTQRVEKGFMSGIAYPIIGSEDASEEFFRRVDPRDNMIRVCSYEFAGKWNGKEMYCSWYA